MLKCILYVSYILHRKAVYIVYNVNLIFLYGCILKDETNKQVKIHTTWWAEMAVSRWTLKMYYNTDHNIFIKYLWSNVLRFFSMIRLSFSISLNTSCWFISKNMLFVFIWFMFLDRRLSVFISFFWPIKREPSLSSYWTLRFVESR